VVMLSLALEGALMAFWLFNRYPAKIFLGDCGSLLIGYIFAVISLVVPIKSFTTAALFMPLVVLGVPLTETASSFIRRLAAGKNVMKADRRHIFHYLAYAGLSQKKIVYLFYLSGLFFGLISIGMLLFNRTLVLSLLLLFMVVIFVIYFIFMARMKKGRATR
jgi:UDP-GlcNAc:undecaprenyl-phosphate GlcNAc-1-phosphate transferase